MMNKLRLFSLAVLLFAFGITGTNAQPTLQNDYSYTMEIPSVVAMQSSAAHLYILSNTEGMAVFRTRRDSLQWLYTAAGMQQRGHTLVSDIRFAYLLGDNRRLTVLEPTSVMGAYSATTLPNRPRGVVRVDDNLYVALGDGGLGKLSLKTPGTLDSDAQPIEAQALTNKGVVDLKDSPDHLYALTDDESVAVFNKNEGGISFNKTISLNEKIAKIFYINNALMGATGNGTIYEIETSGGLSELGSIGEAVTSIHAWKNWLIIKGASNRLWTSYKFTEPTLWKPNSDAGNYIATFKGQLWISEYDRISRVRETSEQAGNQPVNTELDDAQTSRLVIEPIKDQIIPYPNALLIPLKLKGDFPINKVQFNLQADPANAKIRGQSLYWKPKSSRNAEYQFKVIASTPSGQSSSTSFTVDVHPFNSPPRFIPLRTISIPVGRPFNLPIQANDPDATNKNLIRYIGVNLPGGAKINEQSGKFSWTPTEQQVGKNSFRVIATDQYGAASSANVTIRVIETGDGK